VEYNPSLYDVRTADDCVVWGGRPRRSGERSLLSPFRSRRFTTSTELYTYTRNTFRRIESNLLAGGNNTVDVPKSTIDYRFGETWGLVRALPSRGNDKLLASSWSVRRRRVRRHVFETNVRTVFRRFVVIKWENKPFSGFRASLCFVRARKQRRRRRCRRFEISHAGK